MPFSGRNYSLRQHTVKTFADFCDPRTLAQIGLIAGGAFLLAACEPENETDTPVTAGVLDREGDYLELVSTGVMESIDSDGVAAVAFLPDTSTAWSGFIAASAEEGGIDLFDIEGQSVHRMTGSRLWGLAAAPGFQLRGESLPLLFGADRDTNLVRAYALLRTGPELIEAPIQPISPQGDIASVCGLDEGIGYVDLMVLSRGTTAEIWRVADNGGDLISATRRARFDLPSPVRTCAAGNGYIYASGPAGGIVRLSDDGQVEAQTDGYALSLAAGEFLGRPVLILSNGTNDTLEIRDGRTLELIGDAIIRDGFSIPGVDQPGAISATESSYGGTAYQSGLVAVADEADGRIRLIARETFARGIIVID
ncbi:MAG: hypothetical protein COW29_00860 [Rhodobacterales bacterium CG15_BIG_FIL_POST_REV_8_21_14_020_59_13]|nr:MAG: hypothetical protein COW29_00860 [Rhodobacterales bacterium CG15_BIG_FIL_POST_REV_8_21_14_020_59_13]